MTKCLICEGNIHSLGRAVIMPFISHRMLQSINNRLRYTKLLKCNCCGFLFYERRFENFEVSNYYDGYFNEDYFKQRRSFEWWFIEKYVKENEEANRINELEKRKKELAKLLLPYKKEIRTILDYGGNVGGIVPDNFKSFVYDINNLKININKKFDLIMLNCVLEHVSYPKELLQDLKFKYIYIEVPIIKPLVLSLSIKRSFKQYIIDIWKILRYRCLFAMHEHINYFSLISLIKLMQSLDCHIEYCNNDGIVYKILARKKK